jgi:Putative diphthamide synthesis protein
MIIMDCVPLSLRLPSNSLTNFYTTQSQLTIDLSVLSAKTENSTCLRILHTVGEPSVSTPPPTRLTEDSLNSCCVDEVSAQHVDADAVVHYGHACTSN